MGGMAWNDGLKFLFIGVPFYLINERYGISGAQPAEILAAAFNEIARAEEQQD
jgi:predicted DsbA family dithiol-disulfide isomerase